MCKVDKKTITHVNDCMIGRVKLRSISAQDARDNKIVVPVHLLGARQYTMPLNKVNEIYGRAREKAIGMSAKK